MFGQGGFDVADAVAPAVAPGTLAELCEGDGGEEVEGGVAPGVDAEEAFAAVAAAGAACSACGGGLSLLMSSAMLAVEGAQWDVNGRPTFCCRDFKRPATPLLISLKGRLANAMGRQQWSLED